jgi:putative transposase
MRYRRSNTAGATYFITVNLTERRSTTLIDKIDVLRDAFRLVKSRHTVDIDAMVVLPDHLHLLMTLPPDDANFSMRIGAIKSAFQEDCPRQSMFEPLASRSENVASGSAVSGNT